MKGSTVIRQGRTVRISDESKRNGGWCCIYIVLPIICAAVVLGAGIHLFRAEARFVQQQAAFQEVEGRVVPLSNVTALALDGLASGTVLHFSGPYSASVEDSNFGVRLDHALKLQRHAQYCQWQEHSDERCQTCTRTGENGETESYDCNCVRSYTYVKSWSDRLIPSFHFDQPANHHNPQRDPYPSTSLFSGDAKVGPVGIGKAVVEQLRARMDPVTYSLNGDPIKPGFFQGIWQRLFGSDNMRFEDMLRLRDFAASTAHSQEHFVFTSTREGWFFSAYEAPTWQKAVRVFGQFLEGSLFDWQLGDVVDMIDGCTPGDVRVRFLVADPDEVSVLGALRKSGERSQAFAVEPHLASNDFAVGMVHAGRKSPEQLFAGETKLAHRDCRWARAGSLLIGPALLYLIRFWTWQPRLLPWEVLAARALGISLTVIALVWLATHGLSDWAGTDSDIWTVVVGFMGIGLIGCSRFAPSLAEAAAHKKRA